MDGWIITSAGWLTERWGSSLDQGCEPFFKVGFWFDSDALSFSQSPVVNNPVSASCIMTVWLFENCGGNQTGDEWASVWATASKNYFPWHYIHIYCLNKDTHSSSSWFLTALKCLPGQNSSIGVMFNHKDILENIISDENHSSGGDSNTIWQ